MSIKLSFLFVTFEGGGNVPPVLGVAARLLARGHDVTVLTEPCLRGAVETAGARFRAFERHFNREDRSIDLLDDSAARTPLGALRAVLANVVYGPAPVVAAETARAIAAIEPDVVVADAMMPGALVAAEAAGVRRVILFHMPEYLPGPGRPAAGPGFLPRTDLVGRLRDRLMTHLFLREVSAFLPAFNDARQALGLAPHARPEDLLGEFHAADLRLLQTTRAFDFPLDPPPANVRYVGPVLDDPAWTEPWLSPWDARDLRPLVVASLSTTFQNQKGLLQRILTALGGLDVRGLVTLGPAMAHETFDVPANVVTVVSASHAQVFPHASAVVTHAGHGTVMRALSHDLPLLCIPMGRDQDDNAARVFHHGAGLRLGRSAAASAIGRAVGRLLAEPRFRAGAACLGDRIRDDVAADRVVPELEAVGRPGAVRS